MKKIKKKGKKLIIHEQWIEIIKKKNDEQSSTFYPPNDEFERLRLDMDPPPDLIYRRMNFVCGVPQQYSWTNPSWRASMYGGHAIQRVKNEEWPHIMEQERLIGNAYVVSANEPQPRPAQFGPCPCARCKAKREAEYKKDAA